MGHFEDWLQRPGAPLRDMALGTWLDANPRNRRRVIGPNQEEGLNDNARSVSEIEGRFREWDVHKHALQQAMEASEEELHANMLSEHLEREIKDLERRIRRTPWDERANHNFSDEFSDLTQRQLIQNNRVRRAQPRYDWERTQCMPGLRPSPRNVRYGIRNDFSAPTTVDHHNDRFERTGNFRGAYYQLMHIADITHHQQGLDRQEYRRRTAELERDAERFSQTLVQHETSVRERVRRDIQRYKEKLEMDRLNYIHMACEGDVQARKRKFDDDSRRGGGGGAHLGRRSLVT